MTSVGSSRIRVGFHRVGIALAILPSLAAVGTAVFGAYLWSWPLVKPPAWEIENSATGKSSTYSYATAPTTIGKNMKGVFAPDAVPEAVLQAIDDSIAKVDIERREGLLYMAVGAALSGLALIVYAVCWLVGWIVRAFLSDGP